MSTDVLTKFYTYLLTEKCVSPNTFSAYKRDIEQFMDYVTKQELHLNNLTIINVKGFLRYLKEELALSARSVTRKISCLKVLFTFMHDRFGSQDLAQDLTFPKLEKKLPNYLNEDEIKSLLLATQSDVSDVGLRNKVIIYLLYVSGMRISELVNLQISHLHFDTGFIDVLGKGGKMRMVPVPQPIFGLLKNYLITVHARFTQNGKRSTDYLFPIFYAGKVKAITRQAVWGILKHICASSGIEKSIFPHQ
ncbi:MAG: tyrosine-type recombinase/integrase, partial [Candidatus Babeliales bacterium]|nr:tyrosine-type recombinase/integrase [Candidatus Babeliales bacterium]